MRRDKPYIQILCIHLAGLLLFATGVFAQQAGAEPEQARENAAESAQSAPERRVRRLGDVAPDDFELDLTIPDVPPGPAPSPQSVELPDPEQNAALQQLLSTVAIRAEDSTALTALGELLSAVLSDAHALADAGRLEEMQQLLSVVRQVNPGQPGLEEAFHRLENFRHIDAWLAEANAALLRDALLEPAGQNARFFFRQVLNVDPQNEQAQLGMLKVQKVVIARALEAARDFDFELASEWLTEAAATREPQDLVEQARAQIDGFRATQAQRIERDVLEAIMKRKFDHAEFLLIDLIALGEYKDRVERLRERLAEARRYGEYAPGEIIRDPLTNSGILAPPVVVIAAGSFLMGSRDDEDGRADNEGPRHRVTITRGFALGLREVTVDEFSLFIESSGYHTQAELKGSSSVYDEQSGRIMDREEVNWRHDFRGRRSGGDLPVLHVDWYDAQAYTEWLSGQTGQSYRLPTEAEFEYAIRAGSVTPFWWGDGTPGEIVENLTGDGDSSRSGRTWSIGFDKYDDGHWGPAPAGSFSVNAFGLHDMAGNVSEWIMDCWHQTYTRAPVDGSAWINPGCERRVVRGGYWGSAPRAARSASRLSAGATVHGAVVGFRIARDL